MNDAAPEHEAPWYVAAFRAEYLDVYAHRDDAAARDDVAFAARATALGATSIVLDAACGAGRHARELARCARGVVALDLSADLLARAAGRGGGPRYVRGDLRALPFGAARFDAVFSFFTSFGYFDDAGNARQLAEMRRVLRRGAALFVDYLHAAHVRRSLVPRSERSVGGNTLVEERAIVDGRVRKKVTLDDGGAAPRTWRESVALYDPPALRALLVAAGFAVRGEYGDLRGAEFTAASARYVVVAEAA